MATTPANRLTATASLHGSGKGGPRLRDWFSLAVFQRVASQLFRTIFHRQGAKSPSRLLALASLLLGGFILCGCAGTSTQVCYGKDGKQVCFATDGTALKIHGEAPVAGQTLSGDLTLPLPKGLAK